jgi:hypothetical protein
MSNRQVVARLNELEGLVGDAARRRLEAGDGAAPPVAYVVPFSPLVSPFFFNVHISQRADTPHVDHTRFPRKPSCPLTSIRT